jgi:hypothetical protein
MIRLGHSRLEVVYPILRVVVILLVFEFLDEAPMVVTGVVLSTCLAFLLAASVRVFMVDVHPLLAFSKTPCLTVAFVGLLTNVRRHRHIAFQAIPPLPWGHVLVKIHYAREA